VKAKITIGFGLFLFLTAGLLFGQKLTKQQKDAIKQPRAWAAIAARDGETFGLIYNYLYVGDDEQSIKFDYVWYWTCLKPPCQLFTKGDKIVINLPNGTAERRVQVGGKTEKYLIGKLCGGTAGCFEAAFIRGQQLENKNRSASR